MKERNLKTKKQKSLSRQRISNGTEKGLTKYETLNFLERYSMFMGVSQILEIGIINHWSTSFNTT